MDYTVMVRKVIDELARAFICGLKYGLGLPLGSRSLIMELCHDV